jgi:hypothetical protein
VLKSYEVLDKLRKGRNKSPTPAVDSYEPGLSGGGWANSAGGASNGGSANGGRRAFNSRSQTIMQVAFPAAVGGFELGRAAAHWRESAAPDAGDGTTDTSTADGTDCDHGHADWVDTPSSHADTFLDTLGHFS